MRLKLIGALVAVVAMATAAATAFAAKPVSYTCAGGTMTAPQVIPGGTYNGLTVTGTCMFAVGSTITVNGSLTVAPGASLNAHNAYDMFGDQIDATEQINGNVVVGAGGTLGLGSYDGPTGSVVGGNIIANQPQSLYLAFITVRGSLVSHGGSGGPFVNFPLKNLIVGGNVDIEGWSGFWIGLFRSQVAGNVIFANNTATADPELNLDSSEVATNTVAGNLICQGNYPAAQLGDSFPPPNTVSGRALGECAGISVKPS